MKCECCDGEFNLATCIRRGPARGPHWYHCQSDARCEAYATLQRVTLKVERPHSEACQCSACWYFTAKHTYASAARRSVLNLDKPERYANELYHSMVWEQ